MIIVDVVSRSYRLFIFPTQCQQGHHEEHRALHVGHLVDASLDEADLGLCQRRRAAAADAAAAGGDAEVHLGKVISR